MIPLNKSDSRKDKKDPIKGDLQIDIPVKITSGVKIDDNTILLTIEWCKRKNGVTPIKSKYSSADFMKKYPTMLIEFYETKILNNKA